MNFNKHHIALVEPSPVIRHGLIGLVSEREPGFVFHVVNELQGLTGLLKDYKIELVIINSSTAQHNSRQVATIKREMHPAKWVVLMYQYLNPLLSVQYDDIITIEHSADELIEIIQNVLEKGIESAGDLKTESLSEREIDVLKLLVTGYPGKEIADRLNISINTVTSHRKNISQKTGIKSLAGLTIYAVANHVIAMSSLQKQNRQS